MPSSPRNVVFLVASPADLINLVAISAVFSYPRHKGKSVYAIKVLSMQNEREVRGRDDITITSCRPYTEYSGPIDTLIVVGGESAFVTPAGELLRWIRARGALARRVVSVCVGAFVLAPTGLLDGKRVTTHWHHAARLASLYPRLRVDKDKIFIRDGNICSTAGVTAGIDMALALVEEDLGHREVAAIAHTLVLYVRRSGREAQYSPLLAEQAGVAESAMRELPAWARAHLAERLDVSALARAVAMTPRTFARQFEAHFKLTPARWVQSLRIEAACAYLGEDELPVKAIAKRTGFADERALRRAFVQRLAITPKDYRARFGRAGPVSVSFEAVDPRNSAPHVVHASQP